MRSRRDRVGGREGGGRRSTGAQVRLRLKRQEENKTGPERVVVTGDGERGLDERQQREMKGGSDLGLFVWPCSDTLVQQRSSGRLSFAWEAEQSCIFRRNISNAEASQ